MKKLRSNKGFTLAEMLISVLLLGFLSIMATVMTSAVLDTTVTMKEAAQAEILGSEVINNIQSQLRFAQNVRVEEDGSIAFDIDRANTGYTFDIDGKGRIVIGSRNADGSMTGDQLFAGVSYGNLKVSTLNFTLSEDKSSVEISIVISYNDKAVWDSSVSVKPINGMGK